MAVKPVNNERNKRKEQNSMAEIGQYVNAKYIAGALGITQAGIFNLVKAGKFPVGIKIGNSRRWKLQELQAWLDQQRTEANHD